MRRTPWKVKVCFFFVVFFLLPSTQDEISPLTDLPASFSASHPAPTTPPTNTLTVLFHLVNYEWRGPLFFFLRTARCPLSALYWTCTHHILTRGQMERSELTDETDVNKVQQGGTHFKTTQDWKKIKEGQAVRWRITRWKTLQDNERVKLLNTIFLNRKSNRIKCKRKKDAILICRSGRIYSKGTLSNKPWNKPWNPATFMSSQANIKENSQYRVATMYAFYRERRKRKLISSELPSLPSVCLLHLKREMH